MFWEHKPSSTGDRSIGREPSREQRIRVAKGGCWAELLLGQPLNFGVSDIPRKPNYDLERRERERTKAAEVAKKAQAKAAKRAAEQGAPDADGSGRPQDG